MTVFSVRNAAQGHPAASSALGEANAVALRQRSVHRAASDLKRGVPVLLEGDEPLVIVPAETVSARGLSELTALANSPAILLLAPARAATILRRPLLTEADAIALRLTPGALASDALRGLADPTADQILDDASVTLDTAPAAAPAALALAKIARLLPAVLAAPGGLDAARLADEMSLLRVPAADVLDYGRGRGNRFGARGRSSRPPGGRARRPNRRLSRARRRD